MSISVRSLWILFIVHQRRTNTGQWDSQPSTNGVIDQPQALGQILPKRKTYTLTSNLPVELLLLLSCSAEIAQQASTRISHDVLLHDDSGTGFPLPSSYGVGKN